MTWTELLAKIKPHWMTVLNGVIAGVLLAMQQSGAFSPDVLIMIVTVLNALGVQVLVNVGGSVVNKVGQAQASAESAHERLDIMTGDTLPFVVRHPDPDDEPHEAS